MDIQLIKYSFQGISHAMNIYNDSTKYPPYTRVLSYKFLLQNYSMIKYRRVPPRQQIEDSLIDWFYNLLPNDVQDNYEILVDIADTICMNVPYRAQEVLNAVRARDVAGNYNDHVNAVEGDWRETDTSTVKKIKTVYTDSQSVHDSKINSSMKKAAIQLCKDYHSFGKQYSDHEPIILNIKRYLLTTYGDNEKIKDSLYRICTDNATFNMDLCLHHIFVALWWFIMNHPDNRFELEKRLVEELKEMSGLCATGHCSRLINVVQGFSDKYVISISNIQQIKAVVSHYLNKKLQECSDTKVVDGMIDGTEEFKKFIRQVVQEKWEEWVNEYGEPRNITKAVNEYAMVDVL